MRVELIGDKDENPFLSIVEEINRIPQLTQEANKRALTNIGKIIKANVKLQLARNPKVLENYDGTTPAKHMLDDIKVKTDYKSGFDRVIVRGGKYTGYKWHLVDDGTLSPLGNEHTKATHFTVKAMQASQGQIDKYIDEIIAEVANGG